MAKTETVYKAPTMDKLPRGEAAIFKAIDSVKRRATNVQNDIHIAACAVLRHVEEHNDLRIVEKFVNKLLDALPGALRVNALRDWFTAFGPVRFEKNKAVYVKGKPVELAKAMAEPFWKYSPEPDYKPLDVAAMLSSMLKKLATDQEKTGRHHGKIMALVEQAKTELANKIDLGGEKPADTEPNF